MKEPKSQEQIAAELKAKLPTKKPAEAAKAPEEKAKPETQKPGEAAPASESPAEVPGNQAPEKKEEQKPETDKAKEAPTKEDAKPEAKDEEGHRNLKVEKRINELVGELKAEKAERNQDKELIKKLQAELDGLRAKVEKPAQEADKNKKVSESEKARIAKYLAEDKDLPRTERREMTNEEVEEWIVENPVEAQEWIADRAARRREERNADLQKMDVDTEADTIIKKRAESEKRIIQKHPELDFQARAKDLVLSGLSRAEAMKQIAKENPKMKVIFEIMAEPGSQDKYAFSADGPELLMQEMESRLAKNPPVSKETKKETSEEREARIAEEAAEAERQRQAGIDEGARSTRGASTAHEQTPAYKQQLAIMKSLGKTDAEAKAALDRQLARRASMNLQ